MIISRLYFSVNDFFVLFKHLKTKFINFSLFHFIKILPLADLPTADYAILTKLSQNRPFLLWFCTLDKREKRGIRSKSFLISRLPCIKLFYAQSCPAYAETIKHAQDFSFYQNNFFNFYQSKMHLSKQNAFIEAKKRNPRFFLSSRRMRFYIKIFAYYI